MRVEVTRTDVSLLRYEIREIVLVMQKIQEIDPEFHPIGENIGDPIPKGWPVPSFMKEIILEEISKKGDAVFGYSHSRGLPWVRKWVTGYLKRFAPSSTLDYEDVLFTNGLGSAIAILYHMLPHTARVIQPAPAYPTHTSFESFAAGQDPIYYNLNPKNEWQPDLEHLESQIRKHPEVAGMLIINPNNPTSAVYDRSTLEQIVNIAQKYHLMIISDEVYFRMVYNGYQHVQIIDLAQKRVPLIVLRGTSKDLPWPGGRCGWMEFHNTDLDPEFKGYCESLKKRVLMEVCATTLPQQVLPRIYDHPDFGAWNRHYNAELERNGNNIADILARTPGLSVNRANGAFYMVPLFDEGVLNDKQTLPIANNKVREFIETELKKPGIALDKRFAYYLLASTGICIVPATGFFSPYYGFRLTTLDRDEQRRDRTYRTLSQSITRYLNS